MPDFTPTPEQQRAIETTGRSVLVTAAAGSGKTGVLAERCSYLVCDASDEARCDVDRLLVLTFTEAAAAEMRARIVKALRGRLSRSPENARLCEQLVLIDAAQISTLHAFCLWIIRRWFNQAGIEPSAVVMDAEEAKLLRGQVLADQFRRLYERSEGFKSDDRGSKADPPARQEPANTSSSLDEESPSLSTAFVHLVERYGLGEDAAIAEFVLKLYEFLGSLPNPEAWLQGACERPVQRPSPIIDETIDALRAELLLQSEHCTFTAAALRAGHTAGHFHADAIAAYARQCRDWTGRMAGDTAGASERREAFEAVRTEIAGYEFPPGPKKRAPNLPRNADAEARAAREHSTETRKRIRENLCKKRLQDGYTWFSIAELESGLAEIAPFVATLCRLTTEFRAAYDAAKRDRDVLDFADLERLAYRVLCDPDGSGGLSAVARALQERFAHVLVDEFQDINPLQEAIIRSVSREGRAAGGGNLFVVGDVKQSIYRFRLAEPSIFAERLGRFREATSDSVAGVAIALQKNFRSRPQILEAVNLLFRPLMRAGVAEVEYDDEAELRPGRAVDASEMHEPVELHLLSARPGPSGESDDDEEEDEDRAGDVDGEGGGAATYHADSSRWKPIEREAYLIGTMIRAWQKSATGGCNDATWNFGDMVVLLRAKRIHAEQAANVLRLMGIPARADVGGSLLDTREARDIVAALRVLDNPQQDVCIASVMRSGVFGESFTVDELVEIRCCTREAPFHAAVRAFAKSDGESDLQARSHRLLKAIERMRETARRSPLPEVLWELLESHGYLACVCALPNGEQRRANLQKLHDLSRQFGTFRRQGLRRFLRFLEKLREEEQSVEEAPASAAAAQVVRIMSIHQAKGLEFPVVFVAGLGTRFNLRDRRGRMIFERRAGVGLKITDSEQMIEYPSAVHQRVVAEIERTTREEELRVLYVAMTRARDKLVLVGTTQLPTVESVDMHRRTAVPSKLAVVSAMSPIDWLVPVFLGASGGVVGNSGTKSPSPRGVTYTAHEFSEMSTWRVQDPWTNAKRPLGVAAASGAPLPPDEPRQANEQRVDAVVSRLSAVYPFAGVCSIRAAVAASEFKGTYDFTRYPEQADAGLKERRFEVPQSKYAVAASGDALHRGVLTHRLLQHLDYSAAVDRAGLDREMKRMTAAGLLGAEDRGLIDVDGIAWFLGTSTAALIREAGNAFHREFAFVAAEPVSSQLSSVPVQPDDFVMVRGIVDGVLSHGDHMSIIDFKSDGVEADEVAARAMRYAPQLRMYARAVRRLWGLPVPDGELVFLSARAIHTVELSD